jgi:dihydroorotase
MLIDNLSLPNKGSDSAPHPFQSKKGAETAAAGCFTQPWVTGLVLDALQEGVRHGWIKREEVTQDALENFLANHGRTFYQVSRPNSTEGTVKIRLERKGEVIPETVTSMDRALSVVPFRNGEKTWSLTWVS